MAEDNTYDYIVYGDELPGVISAIAFARDFKERTGEYPKVLLMRGVSPEDNVGGHVTNGLGYLDRPIGSTGLDLSQSEIYNEILQKSGSNGLGLDRKLADKAIRGMMKEAGVDLLSGADINNLQKDNDRITAIDTPQGTYKATLFTDATQTGRLAEASGAKMSKGFESAGLENSGLAIGVPFDVKDASIQEVQNLEAKMQQRLANNWDIQAQSWIWKAAGNDLGKFKEFKEEIADFKPLYVQKDAEGNVIGADVRSNVLGIAFHGQSGTSMDLANGPMFDKANIAVTKDGTLSVNNILVRATPDQSIAVDKNNGRATGELIHVIDKAEQDVSTFFSRNLEKSVEPGSQLYVRYAQAVENVKQPLSGTDLAGGGVLDEEASSSFAYHLDKRPLI
jgi:hypothetical protein